MVNGFLYNNSVSWIRKIIITQTDHFLSMNRNSVLKYVSASLGLVDAKSWHLFTVFIPFKAWHSMMYVVNHSDPIPYVCRRGWIALFLWVPYTALWCSTRSRIYSMGGFTGLSRSQSESFRASDPPSCPPFSGSPLYTIVFLIQSITANEIITKLNSAQGRTSLSHVNISIRAGAFHSSLMSICLFQFKYCISLHTNIGMQVQNVVRHELMTCYCVKHHAFFW